MTFLPLVLSLGCATALVTRPPPPEGAMTFTETAVAALAGVRVPIANAAHADYRDVAGTLRTGATIEFMLPDGPLTAGAGTEFTVGGHRFRVHEVRLEQPLARVVVLPAD